jgi:hypothetical protein
MDSKPKADHKDLAAQVKPDRTPEGAMTEYFLSKYEQHFSKYVIICKFSDILTVIAVHMMVIFWHLALCVVLFYCHCFAGMYCRFWNSHIPIAWDKSDLLLHHAQFKLSI